MSLKNAARKTSRGVENTAPMWIRVNTVYGDCFHNFLESVTTVQKQGTLQATENFKTTN